MHAFPVHSLGRLSFVSDVHCIADNLLLGDLDAEPISTASTQSLLATMAPTMVASSTALMPPNKLKVQTKLKAGDTCAASLPIIVLLHGMDDCTRTLASHRDQFTEYCTLSAMPALDTTPRAALL